MILNITFKMRQQRHCQFTSLYSLGSWLINSETSPEDEEYPNENSCFHLRLLDYFISVD